MRIRVNGTDLDIEDTVTIDDLLNRLGYVDRFLAVAINQECVFKKSYTQQLVNAGDDIEILAPMAGG